MGNEANDLAPTLPATPPPWVHRRFKDGDRFHIYGHADLMPGLPSLPVREDRAYDEDGLNAKSGEYIIDDVVLCPHPGACDCPLTLTER
jgi:hypothetical protein